MPWLPSKAWSLAPWLGEPKEGARTEGVKSDFEPLGLARMLVGTGKDGVGGQAARVRAHVPCSVTASHKPSQALNIRE